MYLTDKNKVYTLLKMIEEVQDYAIILLDKEGTIQNWNSGAKKIKGYPSDEIIGKNFSLFYTHEDQLNKKHLKLLEQATKYGRATDTGWRVKKDGTWFWGNITITAIHNEMNEVIGFGKLTRDLTEFKKNELAKALKARELKIKELEQFTYIASHDLQEPLRTVSNYIQIIEEDYGAFLDQQGKEYLSIIDQAAMRMKALVSGLLDHSRLGIKSKTTSVDLNEILKAALTDLKSLIESKKATVHYPKNLPNIIGYKVELHQLFLNLITNAIKFTNDNIAPIIIIGCEKRMNHWEFSIQDNGIGINSKNFDKIFNIFQRTEETLHYEGYGLGLAHCKKIVELHNGKIWVESVIDQGSTFYFNLLSQINE